MNEKLSNKASINNNKSSPSTKPSTRNKSILSVLLTIVMLTSLAILMSLLVFTSLAILTLAIDAKVSINTAGINNTNTSTSRGNTVNTLLLNEYKFSIINNKVVVMNNIIFPEPTTTTLSINIPSHAESLSIIVDEKETNTTQTKETNKESNKDSFILYIKDAREVRISYITNKFLDGQTFLASLANQFDAAMFRVELTLPEGAVLKVPLNEQHSEGSVYPKPTRTQSDGRLITLVWEHKDFKADEEFSAIAMFKQQTSPVFIAAIVFGTTILAILVYAYVINRAFKKKQEISMLHGIKTKQKARSRKFKLEKTTKNAKQNAKQIEQKYEYTTEKAEIKKAEQEESDIPAQIPDHPTQIITHPAKIPDHFVQIPARSPSLEIEKHLKEDEAQIITILKRRDDQQIEQGTLRIITGMPKATLSRILKELEERNIIFKEKRGKRNMVFLREQISPR